MTTVFDMSEAWDDVAHETPTAKGRTPERTCIGCEAKAGQGDLVRLTVVEGRVAVDRKRSGGRGAWIHPAEGCLDRAIKRKAFGRAFRKPDARVDARALWDGLTGSARKH